MIYADYASTTPLDSDVLKQMEPYFSACFGNGSSVHSLGREAAAAAEKAREQIAHVLGAEKNEIYFTSGGTESDNWAIWGTAQANKTKGNHIITSQIEHHAVLNCCKALEKEGFEVTYLPVDALGRVKIRDLEKAITSQTILISIMAANNEIGTKQPLEEIGNIAAENDIAFHTDAVQAVGNMEIEVKKQKITMLSLSAHKFYGPKGIGALFIRNGQKIQNLMCGGSQERDRRPGTLNIPGIVGMGYALEKQYADREKRNSTALAAANCIKQQLFSQLSGVTLNGDPENRLPGNLNFSFEGVQAESLLFLLDLCGISCSAGAACSAGAMSASHVLMAIKRDENYAKSALRITLSHLTTLQEAEQIAAAIVTNVKKIRKASI